MRSAKVALLSIVLMSLLAPQAVTAITIPYDPLDGVNVMYIDISENTRDEPEALFGSPDINGDTMDFDPPNFTASNSGGPATIVDGQLNFTVMSKGDFLITDVVFREAGDFTLAGIGDALAQVSVGAPVNWTVIEVNNAPLVGDIPPGQANMVFTPTFPASLPDDEGTGVAWSGLLQIDMDAYLAENDVVGSATKIEFALDNVLTAAASDGGSAFIAKKDFKGISIGVPEPASLTMVLVGLMGLVGLSRRR